MERLQQRLGSARGGPPFFGQQLAVSVIFILHDLSRRRLHCSFPEGASRGQEEILDHRPQSLRNDLRTPCLPSTPFCGGSSPASALRGGSDSCTGPHLGDLQVLTPVADTCRSLLVHVEAASLHQYTAVQLAVLGSSEQVGGRPHRHDQPACQDRGCTVAKGPQTVGRAGQSRSTRAAAVVRGRALRPMSHSARKPR